MYMKPHALSLSKGRGRSDAGERHMRKKLHGLEARGSDPVWLAEGGGGLHGCALGGVEKWTKFGGGDAQRSSGEPVDISGIDAYNFALQVQHRAAAASAGGGGIVDQFVAADIANVSEGG